MPGRQPVGDALAHRVALGGRVAVFVRPIENRQRHHGFAIDRGCNGERHEGQSAMFGNQRAAGFHLVGDHGLDAMLAQQGWRLHAQRAGDRGHVAHRAADAEGERWSSRVADHRCRRPIAAGWIERNQLKAFRQNGRKIGMADVKALMAAFSQCRAKCSHGLQVAGQTRREERDAQARWPLSCAAFAPPIA